MIYLYRFEVIAFDGLAATSIDPSTFASASATSANNSLGIQRELYLHTNYERDIDFDVNEPFVSGYLPGLVGGPGFKWTFTPAAIEHSEIRLDSEKASGQQTVSLPLGHAIAQLYAYDVPGVQVWLTLAEIDALGAPPRVTFVGQLSSASFDEHRCTLTMLPLEKFLTRQGLTAKHPRTCPFSLGDVGCGVNLHAMSEDGYWKWREDGMLATVSADGLTVTVPEAAGRANGFFESGRLHVGASYSRLLGESANYHPRGDGYIVAMLVGPKVQGGFRRSIISHVGSTLTLNTPLPRLLLATQESRRVTLFAGCDSTLTACKTKFANVPRFGGYPYIPLKNPYEVGALAATK